ncbi:MAG: hypothetical protein KKH08_06055 [Candidatus Omnitrophica bacterium]|nr:hypothetical protein [Candidatus Omnitrophota bacterium]
MIIAEFKKAFNPRLGKVLFIFISLSFFITHSVYPKEAMSLRVPSPEKDTLEAKFSKAYQGLKPNDLLFASKGPDREQILSDIHKFEKYINDLSEETLKRNIREGANLLRFGSKNSPVELNFGKDIMSFAGVVHGQDAGNAKTTYQLRALVNPYDKLQRILIVSSDDLLSVRFHTGEWVSFKRIKDGYTFIKSGYLDNRAMTEFRDFLFKSYFDDPDRRSDFFKDQDMYDKKGLKAKPVYETISSGHVTWKCPKAKSKKWSRVARRLTRIYRPGNAKWPSLLIETVPDYATAETISFWRSGKGRFNYLLFLPLSDRVLIYTEDGIVEDIDNTGRKIHKQMVKDMVINTFINSIYWHEGFSWKQKLLGEQVLGKNNAIPYAHFSVGPRKGGAVFQTYMRQNIIIEIPEEERSRSPSWQPVRRILDDNKDPLAEVFWLDAGLFGMRVKGKWATDQGKEILILLEGKNFYLPFIARLLEENHLVTETFTEKIGSPYEEKYSAGRRTSSNSYVFKNIGVIMIYDYVFEAWGKRPVVVITESGFGLPDLKKKIKAKNIAPGNI